MQFDLGIAADRGRRRLRQPDLEFDRGFCRVDAEIGQRGMAHVVGHEGDQREHRGGGQPVPQRRREHCGTGCGNRRSARWRPRARWRRPRAPTSACRCTPSEQSSANRPVVSATILRNEVTELPGRAAACAAPLRIGEVMFMARCSPGTRECRFGTEIAGTIVGWSRQWRLWFNGQGADLLRRAVAVAIAGARAFRRGGFRCRFKWFCCRFSCWSG